MIVGTALKALTVILTIYIPFTFCDVQSKATAPIVEKTEATAKNRVKCYQCNSSTKEEEKCAESDPDVLSKFIKPCPPISDGSLAGSEATSCRKIYQTVSDVNSIVRECAYTGGKEPVDGKRRTGNKGIIMYLYQCSNENNDKPCNSSPAQFGLTSGILFAFSILMSISFMNLN